MRLTPNHRIAILLHEGILGTQGKTGLAYVRYGEAQVVAVIDAQTAGKSFKKLTQIHHNPPIVASFLESLPYEPEILIIGIAPSGGALPEAWWQEVKQAVDCGLSIVNGLHTPLAPQFPALKPGQWIWDIRQEPLGLRIGKARSSALSCQRILTVGTDMSIGKMSTSLEINRAAQRRGIKSKFLATGQGGIMIAGEGIPLDAIRVDFAAGAVEQMILDCGDNYDLLLVEGQGSLLHPGSTATLPLIRGTQPTGLILVHRAGQTHVRDLPAIKLPSLSRIIELYETVASVYGTFGDVKVKAIALNTFHLELEEAQQAIALVQAQTGLFCSDVVRFGADLLLDKLLE